MKVTSLDAPARWLTRAGEGTAAMATRIPAGHPEGYLEAFATLYTEIARALRREARAADLVPGLDAGLEGMAFISACVLSSEAGSAWVDLHKG